MLKFFQQKITFWHDERVWRLVFAAQLEEDVFQGVHVIPGQQRLRRILCQESSVSHKSHPSSLARLLNVVGRDDDGLALVGHQVGQMGPDAEGQK